MCSMHARYKSYRHNSIWCFRGAINIEPELHELRAMNELFVSHRERNEKETEKDMDEIRCQPSKMLEFQFLFYFCSGALLQKALSHAAFATHFPWNKSQNALWKRTMSKRLINKKRTTPKREFIGNERRGGGERINRKLQ